MSLLDCIFPPQCIICSRVGYEICDYCLIHIPKALPSCCVCKKISTNGATHKGCELIDIPVLYIKGWNMEDKYLKELEKKKSLTIYSIYRYLLFKIIEYTNLQQKISQSVVYPLSSNLKDVYNLNRYLAVSLNQHKGKEMVTLVGESLESLDVLKQQIGALKRDNIKEILVITIF